MDLTLSEQITYSVIQILMLDSQKKLKGAATGFIVGFCESDNGYIPALVTNRHVLETCTYVNLIFTEKKPDGSPNIGTTVTATISTSGAIFHPNSTIDLAILPVAHAVQALVDRGCPPFYLYLQTNLIPTKEDWDNFDAIEDVVMAGYPEGLRDTINNYPIVRRGITATHPALNFKGAPEFLVDMSCFKGCSGSPVFMLNSGMYVDKKQHSTVIGNRIFLLGIQRAVPLAKVTGTMEVLQSDTSSEKPVIPLYLNLGFVIKSTELLAFEPIIRSAISHRNSV